MASAAAAARPFWTTCRTIFWRSVDVADVAAVWPAVRQAPKAAAAQAVGRRRLSSSGAGAASDKGRSRGAEARESSDTSPDSGDLYAVLGVPRGSAPDEIKAAFRRVAKECHPDARPDDAAAGERFRAATHAHETLLHVGMRRMYDLHLRREDVYKQCVRLEEQEAGFMSRHPLAVGLVSIVGLSAGAVLLLTQVGGGFWACFRYIPDWAPGKWRLAEAYAAAELRRREATEAQR